MTLSSTSFAARADDVPVAVETLIGLGFVPDRPRSTDLVLLDTFDGRIQRAGLRLRADDTEPTMLGLAGPGAVDAQLAVAERPRFASEIPPGPFRDRLLLLTDVRALLAQLELATTRTTFTKRGGSGGTTAIVHLDTPRRLAGVALGTGAAEPPEATIEVTTILGAPRPAQRAIDAMTELGLAPVAGDVLHLVAEFAGVDTAGFASSATVPIEAGMPAADGFARVLANLADTIEANWDGTVAHVDPEFLHDLRVAVRRTRTVLGEGKQVLPSALTVAARNRFAEIGALTGPARDLDVYLIEWERYVRPLGDEAAAALEPVRALLAARQSDAHAHLDHALSAPGTREWFHHWHRTLGELPGAESPGEHAQRRLGTLVARRIERAQARLIRDGRAITTASPAEQVHDLRKDAKKVRYLLECFESILPGRAATRFLKHLKALQENLGVHQDAEVHVVLIREVAETLHTRGATSETLVAMGRLAERLDQIRIGARAEFAERFAAYDTSKTQAVLDEVLTGIRR